MSHGTSDRETIETQRNTARYFVETRHVAWVLLALTVLWGVISYVSMPQRKDPEIAVRTAVALCTWPGASAERVEQLVTKKIEETMAQNAKVTKIESISRTGLSVVYVELDENLAGAETGKQFDDIKLKLDAITDMPEGVGKIDFVKDFGDTAALMLTVASPKASDVEVELRADAVAAAIRKARAEATAGDASRFTIVVGFPQSIPPEAIEGQAARFREFLESAGDVVDARPVVGVGFVGFDGASSLSDEALLGRIHTFVAERLHASEFHPDSWAPTVIRDPADARAKLAEAIGDKYTYRELDDFTDQIEKRIKTIPSVSKVDRVGLLPEQVYLYYSQERLASYGIQGATLSDVLSARNITVGGGRIETSGKNITVDPSGEFKSEREIGDVAVTTSESGAPVYLRDLVDIVRGYENPPRFLNFYDWRDAAGVWHRTRAVTLAVQMRSGENISDFGKAIDEALGDVKTRLPEDLIMARTSDQPLQVTENIDLFMTSLYEAIVLVVLISLIGFWEWRSALLMAISIPITLLMTFGMMHALGVDLQQVSIATLIIALGLLVDDPVVAGDAMKRELATGQPSIVAAWLGPTKLAGAIMYATVTNIVAYLPFLLLTGTTREFIYSLPIVLTCSLVASRLVSMTFIPLLGYYLLRPKAEVAMAERRTRGFAAWYYRAGTWAIDHRWKVLAGSFVFLAFGGFVASQLKAQFFPKDLSYLSYVDVWLPEDAPLSATDEAARRAEAAIRNVAKEYGREHPGKDGQPRDPLESLTTFVGGGGPRFWFSVSPEQRQLNYAQIIIQVQDKHDTSHLIGPLQEALSAIPGARIDVRQLESGSAVGLPVAIRFSGDDMATLRGISERAQQILRDVPSASRVRDDWGDESFSVKLGTDADRANLAGVTNLDVAGASAAGLSGKRVTTLREGDRQIPVVAKLRMEERAGLDDIGNLYVYSASGSQKVPLRQVSSVDYQMQTEKLRRRNQFRTVTVSAMPVQGALASEVMSAARPQLEELARSLPPGYRMEIGGEEEDRVKGFVNLAVVLLISVVAIFLALVFQFKNAIKPLIVFAAVPYGMVGALIALWVMGTPFGFMAFLGIVSLVGVIVSHVIVLFDFIEEAHAEGEPLREALLDAGILRLRPVMITVGATVIALFPLAAHGGPLWEPMCYAQIGGLAVATFITLGLVPVIYSIFVLDLKAVRWTGVSSDGANSEAEVPASGGETLSASIDDTPTPSCAQA